MNDLTYQEIVRINNIISKIRNGMATTSEMQEFLNLIKKSGQNNWIELQNSVSAAGYVSVEDFQRHLKDKSTNEFLEGLVKIGLAILIAYGISKLFEEK